MFIDCIDITGPAITIDNTNNCLERIKEIFPAGAVPNVGMVAGWFVMPLQSVYNYTGLGTTLNILELEDASGNEILRVQMLPNQLRVRWGPTTGGQLKSVNLNNNSGVQINRSALQYQSDGTTPISAQANRIKILWAVSFSGTQMNVMYAYEDAAGNLVSAEGGYANTTYVGNTAVTNLHLFVHTLNALAGAHGFITVRNHETTLAEIQGIYRNIGQVAGAGDPARLMWHTGGNWTGRTGCVWQMHGGLSGEMGSSNITDTEVRYKAREGFAVRDDNMNFYAVLASGGTPNPAGDMDAGHLDAVTVMDTGNELTWKWNETLGFNLEEDPETLAILNFATYPYQAGFRATSRSQAAFEFFNQSATRQWRLWAHGNSRVGGTADDLSEQWISNNLTAFEYGVAATRGYWQGMTLYLQETNPHLIVGGITSANPERGNTGLVFYTGYHSGSLGFNRNDYDVVWPTNTSVHRVDMCRAALVTAKSGTRVGGGDITWIKPGGYAVLMQPNLEPIQGDDPIDIFVGVLRYPHAPDALNVRRVWSMAEVTGGPPAGTTATPAHDEEDASPTEMTGFNSVPPLTGSVKVHSYNAGALELDLPDDAIAGSIPAAGRIVTISDGTNMHFGMITSFTGLPDNTATLEFTFGVAPTIVADTSHDAFWGNLDCTIVQVQFDGSERVGSDIPDYRGLMIEIPAGDADRHAALVFGGWKHPTRKGFIFGEYYMGGYGTTQQYDSLWEQDMTGLEQTPFERILYRHGVDILFSFPATQNEFDSSADVAGSIALARAAVNKVFSTVWAANPSATVLFVGGPIIPSTLTNSRYNKETGNKTAIACWNALCEDFQINDAIAINGQTWLGHPSGQYAWGFRMNPAHETARGAKWFARRLMETCTADSASIAALRPLTGSGRRTTWGLRSGLEGEMGFD